MQVETTFEKFPYRPNVTSCLQLNEYETVPFFHQSKPKFDLDSLLIYVFCTTCVHEIVLSVLQIKRKTMPKRIYNSHYGNGVPAMFTS